MLLLFYLLHKTNSILFTIFAYLIEFFTRILEIQDHLVHIHLSIKSNRPIVKLVCTCNIKIEQFSAINNINKSINQS